MKTCPMCAEQIQDEARKCRFCGEVQATPEIQATPEAPPPQNPCWTCGRPMVMKPGTQVPWCEACSGPASYDIPTESPSLTSGGSQYTPTTALHVAGGLLSMMTAKSVLWLFVVGVVGVACIQTCMSSDDIAAKAAASRLRAEREDAERQSQHEADTRASGTPTPPAEPDDPVCGPSPSQSGWDGMLGAVNRYLHDNLNDPSSYEGLGCTPPQMTEKACWVSRCRFRAKNEFGALVAQEKRFYIGRNPTVPQLGRVLKVQDVR